MTVKEIIAEGLRILGERNDEVISDRVNDALETVGLLPEHASRYPHEFSGGQRQRIGIARALIVQPEFIIADEPLSALDVSIQAQVINLLNDLRSQFGITIMFIAHDLSVIKYFSDRIGVMYFGNLVELAPADELFRNPLHPYTRSLLSAVPLPDPRYEKNRQRVSYNPRETHDYSVSGPELVEIKPGHFILANDKEIAEYKKVLK
jgi:ABC-type oligopeptide transport system ATPase subunit